MTPLPLPTSAVAGWSSEIGVVSHIQPLQRKLAVSPHVAGEGPRSRFSGGSWKQKHSTDDSEAKTRLVGGAASGGRDP